MASSFTDDYLLGALVLFLVIAIAWLVRASDERHKNEGFVDRFTWISPPATGWDSVKDGEVYGGTIPGWGEDYARPPY